jgi:ferredoxin
LGGLKLTQTPEEFKSPAKSGKPDQDPQPKLSKADQPGRGQRQLDDPFADPRRHDPDTAPPPPVPPIDSLDKDSDIKGFMSPKICEDLRRSALRKFFHLPKFNRRDGLDDYEEDFQVFQQLGNILTSDMQYHMERLAEQKTGSRLKRDPPANRPSEVIEESAGTSDSKSGHISPPKIVEPIPDMEKVGDLFHHPVLCAHGARGLTGCTRCLEVCPAGAISIAGGIIRIDPEICRQKGLCATVCPTDALRLSMPNSAELPASIRLSLTSTINPNPVVIFHGAGFAPELLQTVPRGTLRFSVDSIEAVGMDTWLAALAYGASHVVVLAGDDITPTVFDILQTQVFYATKILEGLGLEKERIQMIRADHRHQEALFTELIPLAPVCSTRPARFSPDDTKRTLIFQSIDYLYEQSPKARPLTALAEGAPFGEIIIDPNTCTLCMACVAICPAQALYDGGEIPQIHFFEGHCVQCGLCRCACPENAIRLSPRMVFDPKVRSSLRILNQAESFCCSACGRPFATKAIVDKMVKKLSGHWMYQNDAAKQRLFMCRECRARDFFEADACR